MSSAYRHLPWLAVNEQYAFPSAKAASNCACCGASYSTQTEPSSCHSHTCCGCRCWPVPRGGRPRPPARRGAAAPPPPVPPPCAGCQNAIACCSSRIRAHAAPSWQGRAHGGHWSPAVPSGAAGCRVGIVVAAALACCAWLNTANRWSTSPSFRLFVARRGEHHGEHISNRELPRGIRDACGHTEDQSTK